MTVWLCTACGVEHPDTMNPPHGCFICLDERQYVPPAGQTWTTAAELAPSRDFAVTELEPDLFALTVQPEFAIGQRTLLLRTAAGNLLWEPSGFISAAMVAAVGDLGGVAAVASSHPHLVGASVSWSQAFDGAPIFWNLYDQRWVQRPDPAIEMWARSADPLPGIRLVQAGGHFPGSSVLHWPNGAEGRGVLFSGDTLMAGPGGQTVSFMRSYPNYLPLSERLVRGILSALRPLAYDRIYGAFPSRVIAGNARYVVARSADRYIGWLRDEIRDPDEESDPILSGGGCTPTGGDTSA